MGYKKQSLNGEFSSDLVRFKVLRAYLLSKGVTVFNTMSGLAVNTVSEPCQKFVGVTESTPND